MTMASNVQDSAYSWYALFASFLCNCVYAGVLKCQGALYLGIMYTYGASREQASRPLTLLLSFRYLSGLLVGPLSHYSSYRTVILIAVVISAWALVSASFIPNDVFWLEICTSVLGVGLGLVVPSAVILISTYFIRNRGKALALYSSGYPVGGFIYPFLADIWLEKFSLRATWLILAAIFVQLLVFVVAVRPIKQSECIENSKQNKTSLNDKTLKPQTDQNDQIPIVAEQEMVSNGISLDNVRDIKTNNCNTKTNNCGLDDTEEDTCTTKNANPKSYINIFVELFKSYKFYTLLCIVLVEGISSMTFTMTIIDHGNDAGLTRKTSTHFVVLESVGDLCGRLLVTSFIDKKLTSNEILVALGFATSSSFYIVVAFASTYWTLACASYMIGFCYGFGTSARFSMYPALGVDKSTSAFGIGEFVCGFVMPIISVLIGIFRDGFGSYFYLYIIFSAFRIFVIIFLLVDDYYTRKQNRRK